MMETRGEITRIPREELALARSSPTSFCTTSSICEFINGVDAMYAAEL